MSKVTKLNPNPDDYSEMKIDKGVPLPPRHNRGVYPFERMVPGDSISARASCTRVAPAKRTARRCCGCGSSNRAPIIDRAVHALTTERKTTVVNRRSRQTFDVDISRRGPWGNPFRMPLDGDREQVIAKFETWLMNSDDPRAIWIRDHVGELRGKRLGCYCAPLACHGDVLAEMACDFLNDFERA